MTASAPEAASTRRLAGRRWARLAVVALLSCGTAGCGGAVALVGEDDRRPAPEAAWVDAVGLLSVEGGGRCTAALIAPDVVVTGGHCAFDEAGGRPHPPQKLIFQAGLRDGRAIVERRGVVSRFPDEYDSSDRRRHAHDLAAVRLDAPIEEIVPLRIAAAEAGVDAALAVVSYSRSRPGSPSLEDGCRRDLSAAAAPGEIATTCDADFGASGAPVFVQAADDAEGPPKLLAVMVGAAILERTRERRSLALLLSSYRPVWGPLLRGS